MILNKLIKSYSKLIGVIKKMNNCSQKQYFVGSIIAEFDGKGVKPLALLIGSSFRYVKKCYLLYTGEIKVNHAETRGRKPITVTFPHLLEDLITIIEHDVQIDPKFSSEVMYVRLTLEEIRKRLISQCGYDESTCPRKSVISKVLNANDYKLKKIKKTKPLKKIPQTDAIFDHVTIVKNKAIEEENTVIISIDAKDKVAIGEYSRDGKNRGNVVAFDHDLTNHLLTPFGILDIKTNTPYFYCVQSKVTASCIVDTIKIFWETCYHHTDKNRLVILLDNGPENASGRTYFIKGLIEMAEEYRIEIELCYYPPYHSKYNPIERLWARVENIWNGYLLNSIEIVCGFLNQLTWKGQRASCQLITKEYCSGLSMPKKEFEELQKGCVTRSNTIPKWSLVINH